VEVRVNPLGFGPFVLIDYISLERTRYIESRKHISITQCTKKWSVVGIAGIEKVFYPFRLLFASGLTIDYELGLQMYISSEWDSGIVDIGDK
jgi:hypothetical protein